MNNPRPKRGILKRIYYNLHILIGNISSGINFFCFQNFKTVPFLYYLGDILLRWDIKTSRIFKQRKNRTVIVFGMYKSWIIFGLYLSFLFKKQGYADVIFLYTAEPYYSPHLKNSDKKTSWYKENILKYLKKLTSIKCLATDTKKHLTLDQEQLEWIKQQSLYDTAYISKKEKLSADSAQESLTYSYRYEKNVQTLKTFLSLLKNTTDPLVCLPNGRLLDSGIINRVCLQLKIEYYSYETYGTDQSSLLLTKNSSCTEENIDELWEKTKNFPLTPEQNVWLENLAFNRRNPSSLDGSEENFYTRICQSVDINQPLPKEVETFLNRPGKIALLCGNLSWDSLTLQKGIFYRTMIDWVENTIDFFKNHPEWNLVIRAHPDEQRWGSKEQLGDHVKNILNIRLPNILTISSEDKINTYHLMKYVDLGLIWTSLVGCEMAMLGIPVIVTTRVHYKNKGFTIDPESCESYKAAIFSVLNGNPSVLPSHFPEIAKLYYYTFLNSRTFDVGFNFRGSTTVNRLSQWPLKNSADFFKFLGISSFD